jgi:hypothetical protein
MNTTNSNGEKQQPGRIASWWQGRYGAQLALEIALCGALLIIYRAIRTFSQDDLRTAFSNSRDVIKFESWLGLPFEDNLQGWLLEHPTLIRMLNHYYILFHFPVAIGMLLWLYLRHPDHYRPLRNLMAFVTFAALVIHVAFPLAPPRWLPGFVDTMSEFGPGIYPRNALDGAANQIAAMPSLHFGWAMIAAIAVITVCTSRWRWLAVLHPTLMGLAIVGTGNHWWIDAAAAGVLIVGTVAGWRLLTFWIGERVWSWRAFRFKTRDGVAELEEYANSNSPESREQSSAEDVAGKAVD